MANPQIRSFTLSSSTVAPGGSVVGTVDAYDPDNRTVRVQANVGGATAVTVLTVNDNPIPNPVFSEVDANGGAVTPTLDFVPDPLNPMRVTITARQL